MSYNTIYVISDDSSALKEFCGGAKKLASKVKAVVFGDEAYANAAASCGADSIIYCPVSDPSDVEGYAKAIAETIKSDASALAIVFNDIRGRLIAGKLGVYLDAPVLTTVNTIEKDGEKLVLRRMVYGGVAQSKETIKSAYGVITMSTGIFEDYDELPATTNIKAIEGTADTRIKLLSREEKKEATVNLAVAKRIVDVGRGLAKEEDLEMMRKLAAAIGGEVGCSRPVAENNKWMPKACYMGITGVSVKPELLIAIGVSGQVQHIGGINKSKVIVCINKDKDAPIFKNSDFGLVADMYKVLPMLIEKLS